MKAVLQDFGRKNNYALTATGLLFALLIVAAIRGPELFNTEGLTIAFAVAAPLVLASMAVTPPAISGRAGVDLSIGPLLAFTNVTVFVWLIANGVTSPFLVVPFAVGVGALVGLINGLVIATVRLQPVVVTLGSFLVLSGLAALIQPRPRQAELPSWLLSLTGTWGGIPSAAVVLVLVCVAWLLVSRSTYFRNVRLLGYCERTAYSSGVPVIRVRVGAYVLGGMLAGVGGLMLTSLLASADPNTGSAYTLTALTALVLGGTSILGGKGGMTGSVIAAFDVYLIQYVLSTFEFGKSAAFVNQFSNGMVLLIALAIGTLAAWYMRRKSLL
ncbi:MAG: ABC transporter permease [Thermoleophilia bacterium]|nr:ABC transporter permease [Thermoleophilia bacterium]